MSAKRHAMTGRSPMLLAALMIFTATGCQAGSLRMSRSVVEEDTKYFPEEFEFDGTIELVNGLPECIQAKSNLMSQIIVETLKETDSDMDALILQNPKVLATGATFSVDELVPETSKEEDGSHRSLVRFRWLTSGRSNARMSYPSNSDGFIPALAAAQDSSLNYNLPKLVAQQAAAIQEKLGEQESLEQQLRRRQRRFYRRVAEVTANLEAREHRIAYYARRYGQRWYNFQMEQVKQVRARVENAIDRFENDQIEARLKMEAIIDTLHSFHEMEVSTVMVAREPAWNDFKQALGSFTELAKENIENKLAVELDDCFPDENPNVDMVLTPIAPALSE